MYYSHSRLGWQPVGIASLAREQPVNWPASCQDTSITGRRLLAQFSSCGLCLQPASATQVSRCANVTSNLPMAKALTATLRYGPSLPRWPRSLNGVATTASAVRSELVRLAKQMSPLADAGPEPRRVRRWQACQQARCFPRGVDRRAMRSGAVDRVEQQRSTTFAVLVAGAGAAAGSDQRDGAQR